MFKMMTESVETSARNQLLDVTHRVQKLLSANRIQEGIVCVFVPHTTAGVMIQENADPATQHDFLKKLETLVPQMEGYYQHDEGNSDAHVKAALVGTSVIVPIEAGRLALGRWQAIYFCEFDGPRERRMQVKIIGSDTGRQD
jgi:secondary thiamine-phosphate synthase enzyme